MAKNLTIDTKKTIPPTRDLPAGKSLPDRLLEAKKINTHPIEAGDENASLLFVGTATTILEWEGLRLMTDPNFLHAGDHIHLGLGVIGTRQTNPALDIHDLPNIDAVLLSHYHADHFDQLVEELLRRDLPIISTPHLDPFESMFVNVGSNAGDIPRIKVTGMPGKHVPDGVIGEANKLAKVVPPTNGWMLELGYGPSGDAEDGFKNGYRIYISGDTLMVDDLTDIPKYLNGKNVDLMLIHLGGTTIPSPKMPLLMVTMDAKQGLQLVKLICPDLTIPIHYDDYDAFISPLSDFKDEMTKAGLDDKVVYLDRGDAFHFQVRK